MGKGTGWGSGKREGGNEIRELYLGGGGVERAFLNIRRALMAMVCPKSYHDPVSANPTHTT